MRSKVFPVLIVVSLAWANAPPLRADLVSHFTFDGNLLDTGPAGNNGTFVGGAAPVFVDGRDGTPGGAISLDGVDDYVVLARTAGLPLSSQPAFTVAMWVKSPLPTATVRDRRFFSEGSTTSNNPLFNLGTDTAGVAGVVDFFYRSDANVTVVNHRKSSAIAFDNAWHHVAWVDTNGTAVLYIDGLPDAISFNYARAVLTTNTTTIGAILRAAAAAFFPGSVDDVRLYNHALTIEELQDIIEAPGCPADGDTTCTGLTVNGPPGNAIGTYSASATAADVSGDPVLRYTFSATNADDGGRVGRGPGAATTADFVLGVGHWTIAVTVDDELFCFDAAPAATCSTEVVISPPPMLVSRWSFDSTLEDSEAAGNDGTFFGGAAVYEAGFDGTAAGAITFDGVDDYVQVLQQSGLPIYASPAHTIALWVKGLPQGDRRLYSEGSTTSNTPLLNVGTEQAGITGKADIFIRSDANTAVVNHRLSGRDILDGTWHHVAWVDANGAAVLYIDGLREPTDFSYPRSLLTLNTTSIGAVLRAAPCCYFAGAIDEARVYNYALTLAEIEAIVPELPDCTGDADTHCTGLEVTGPADRASGTYVATATASDTSGDTALLYTFTAREAGGASLQAGPSALANASFQLSAGTWTISVLTDDHARCRDAAVDASCTEVVEVLTEPAILLSRLPFNGDTLDAEPAGNDGTYLGEPQAPFLRGYDCTNGGALRFDGTNDFLELEQAARLPIHKRLAYSVAMWVKGPSGQIDRRVFSESSRTNRTPLFNIGTDSTGATGTVDLFLRSDAGQTPLAHVRSAGTAFDGEWHHLAWVDQSGDARLYIDGVEDATNFDYVPAAITLDATTVGGIVRTSATTGLDDACCFFNGVIDDVRLFTYALSADEVLALHGTGPGDCCPDAGDTRCSGLEVAGPEGMGPGDYTLTASASDDSGDAILYSFRAQLGAEVLTAGPQTGNAAVLALTEGTWTVSVTVDDDLECPDVAPEATCTREVMVCPAAGDTHCSGLTVVGPDGNLPGVYELSAAASDDSGDSILYTFRADSLSWDPLSIGPQPESTATFELLEGDWKLSVTVDDGEACLDTAEDAGCSEEITVNPGGAGPFIRGDSNDDAKLDIADPIYTLNWLFLESRPAPPCAAAADSNADGLVNISDPSHSLNHLFVGGPAPLPPFPECGRSTLESDRLLGCAIAAGCSA
jgi:hypothetical protein